MPIDTTVPGSPGWRLQRLARKLEERQRELEQIYARYENRADMPPALRTAPEAAQKFFKMARTGFAETVVKAMRYPLRLQSFSTASESSRDGDPAAYLLAKTSGMLEESDDVHRSALVAGNGYAMVFRDAAGGVCYTHEDPRQVVTRHDPVRQSVVTEGLKAYHDDDDQRDYFYLYTRENGSEVARVRRAYRDRPKGRGGVLRFSAAALEWDESRGGEDGEPLPPEYGGSVPIFRYRNEEGVGEFARHMDLLDRLDHMVLQGMVIATMQAFKQRAIKEPADGLPDVDEDTGEKIDYNEVLQAGPDRLWILPATADIWESGNVDLTPIWTGLDRFTQQFSAVTFTPLAVFSPEGQNQSAAGASFAREGRTLKVEDRQDRFGHVHARALALLFALSGDEVRADHAGITVQWRPAERYSLADKGDALTKYKAGDVPWETRMIEVGQFTPTQVAQMRSEREADLMLYPTEPDSGRAAGGDV